MCKRFESFRLCDGRFCIFLFLEWSIQILYSRQGFSRKNLKSEFICHKSLFFDKSNHILLSCFQIFGIAIKLIKITQLLITCTFSHFLTITSNKGNCIPLIQKLNNILDNSDFHTCFLIDNTDKIHIPSFYKLKYNFIYFLLIHLHKLPELSRLLDNNFLQEQIAP